MSTQIALLRGINVGKAKRIAMADLRKTFADLGYANVRTLLNSGNVVFDAARRVTASSVAAIGKAIAKKTGVNAAVIVVSAADVAAIVAENPLGSVVTNPSRCLVAFPSAGTDLAKATVLIKGDWGADRFAIGTRATYLWCADGILASELAKAFDRLMGTAVTARNWATVLKLHAMSSS